MRKLSFLATLLICLVTISSTASAISFQGGLAYSNSNLYAESDVFSGTSDLDARLGITAAVNFPVNPMMEIQAGLTYYTAAGNKEMEGLTGDTQKIGLMPIEISAKFSIPGLGMTGVNPYAGVGINYTTWTPDPAFDSAFVDSVSAGLGYFAYVGANFGTIFVELGYTWMKGSMELASPMDETVNIESRGIYLKGGMLLGI